MTLLLVHVRCSNGNCKRTKAILKNPICLKVCDNENSNVEVEINLNNENGDARNLKFSLNVSGIMEENMVVKNTGSAWQVWQGDDLVYKKELPVGYEFLRWKFKNNDVGAKSGHCVHRTTVASTDATTKVIAPEPPPPTTGTTTTSTVGTTITYLAGKLLHIVINP